MSEMDEIMKAIIDSKKSVIINNFSPDKKCFERGFRYTLGCICAVSMVVLVADGVHDLIHWIWP